MPFLVYVRGNFTGRLEPQVWPVLYPHEAHRVAARHEIDPRVPSGLPDQINFLVLLYPPPAPAPPEPRIKIEENSTDAD